MPREMYMVSTEPVTLAILVVAANAVDEQLALRALYEGNTLQLVDENNVAVLTIDNSRLLTDTSDAARVTRGLSIPAGQLWWTDATAPWGARGVAGPAVMRELASILEGNVRVEEGL